MPVEQPKKMNCDEMRQICYQLGSMWHWVSWDYCNFRNFSQPSYILAQCIRCQRLKPALNFCLIAFCLGILLNCWHT